jgi:prepilin-type N-terminal cleavage/methylation domain-containing protein
MKQKMETDCRRASGGAALGRTGFSLVETMVVLLVVAVLVVIAVPSFVAARVNTKREQAKAELEILAAGIRQLVWDTGRWPGGLLRDRPQDAELWDLTTSSAGLIAASPSLFPGWKGAYVPGVPSDPWGSPYFFDPDYRVSGVNRVAVGSFGPNRQGRNLYDSDDLYIILQ